MPEGPELHLASLFVNRVCKGVVFTGDVEKSEVSKCPEVPFACEAYHISAKSRGKEVMLTLTPIKCEGAAGRAKAGLVQPMNVVFRFGMSGYFRFTPAEELPKHAHLRFYTNEKPRRALSFVDARRFGSWQPNGTWQPDRGPCTMSEYQSFRDNVLSHLSDRAFDKPICETLLNQKYFNGIGNYLRAEILHRLDIPPFVNARSVLERLQSKELSELDNKSASEKREVKSEGPDLLSLCHTVPLEVVQLGKVYDPEKADYSYFKGWVQCYSVDGMKSVRDHNGRTIWFKGDPGPLAPKDSKSPKGKKRIKKEGGDYTENKKLPKKKQARVTKKDVKQEKRVKKEKETQDEMRPKRGRQRKQEVVQTQTGTRTLRRRVTRRSARDS
ncbi:endonuclease 8-like 1 isoform X2 [Anguilla rostrata]|uniref:endonuclease 8-like 1 isoform X2 n=1 Tax=Anguilla rostrata TaxID=7938 RepID=UPI0030CBAC61